MTGAAATDELDGLQHERTELGWRRTGLAAAGLTGVFARTRIEHLDRSAAAVLALSAAVVLVVLGACYRRGERRDGMIPAFVTGLIVLVAVAQLASVGFG